MIGDTITNNTMSLLSPLYTHGKGMSPSSSTAQMVNGYRCWMATMGTATRSAKSMVNDESNYGVAGLRKGRLTNKANVTLLTICGYEALIF